MKNKNAKNELIRILGPECFIEKLHLRQDENKRYKSKKQMKKMQALTYHHIAERARGGRATVENGALLSRENHDWFNEQTPEVQAELNKKFQEYKACKVKFVDDIDTTITVNVVSFNTPKTRRCECYDRTKVKQETQKLIKEYEERE